MVGQKLACRATNLVFSMRPSDAPTCADQVNCITKVFAGQAERRDHTQTWSSLFFRAVQSASEIFLVASGRSVQHVSNRAARRMPGAVALNPEAPQRPYPSFEGEEPKGSGLGQLADPARHCTCALHSPLFSPAHPIHVLPCDHTHRTSPLWPHWQLAAACMRHCLHDGRVPVSCGVHGIRCPFVDHTA